MTSSSTAATPAPMRVAVTGASGLVGSRLVPALAARGHEVVALSRSAELPAGGDRVRWARYHPGDAASIDAAIRGADAVVHLAGEGLFTSRWSDAVKTRLRESRVVGTRRLVEAIGSLAPRPRVLVSASAIGWYGPLDPDATVDEAGPPGSDFLSEVCVEWEAEARKAEALGVRVVLPRFGIVLAREGGAVAKMLPPFKLFVGGPVGSGRQVLSWIHVGDLVSMLVAMLEDERWRGPVNATSPRPVDNREFSKALGRALGRPAFLPTPGFALRLLLGEVASLVTTGQRVLPRVAEGLGFGWRFPTVDAALSDLLRMS